MKKVLVLFLALFISVQISAQESHMRFMGIPITGKNTEFILQLKQKGFTVQESFNQGLDYILSGKFGGFNGCTILVLASDRTQTVFKVLVYFPQQDTWGDLKRFYTRFQKAYSIKYKPLKSFSFFMYPYKEGDGYEIDGVTLDKCRYATFYEGKGGHVSLQISHVKQVLVTYEDDYNLSKAKNEENK